MEIKIETEKLRQVKLFVATPCYGGNAHGLYIKSCLDLQSLCMQHGVDIRFSFIFNESLIPRARNYLVDEFLRSGCTHLLFIDADVFFHANDIFALLALDKDVVGIPYVKKSINWNNVFQAAIKNAGNSKFNPAELENVVGDYVFNPIHGKTKFNVNEPLEVMEIGTGYMMIKRHVFDKMKEEFPHLEYRPDHLGQANFDGSRMIHAYFDTIIDPDSQRYLSEDYFFCQNWRQLGGSVWLCPWGETQHIGTYPFRGNMQAIASLTGRL